MGRNVQGYELYEFLTRKIVAGIVTHIGSDKEAPAKAVADAVCDDLIHEWGGFSLYLPKGTQAKCSAEAELIWSEFNGANYGELAKKFGKSDMRIRQIVNAMRRKSPAPGGDHEPRRRPHRRAARTD